MKKFLNVKLIIFLLIASYFSIWAQKIADPLNPEKFQTQREIGLVFGLGPNWQSGSFRTACDCPHFEDGSRAGWTAGLLYEQDFDKVFQWGLAGLFSSRSITASYQIRQNRPFTSELTGSTESIPILFEQKAEADIVMLSVMPYLKWDIFYPIFIKLGFEAGFIASAKIRHTESLLQKTARLSTGEVVNITFGNGKSDEVVVEEGHFPEISSFQMNINPMIGINMRLAKNVFLSPVFQFSYPLTNISTFGDGFKITSWRLLLEMRLGIQLRQK